MTTVRTFKAFADIALWTGLGGKWTFAAVQNLRPTVRDQTSTASKWWQQPVVPPLLLWADCVEKLKNCGALYFRYWNKTSKTTA